MNSHKRLKFLLTGLLNVYDRNEIDDVVITESEIEFRSRANILLSFVSYSIFILMTFLPPILLAIYEESKWTKIIALIWIAIFSNQFIRIIRYDNKVKIQISDQFVLIENEDSVGQFFIKEKRIDSNQIREFETKSHWGQYGYGHTGIIMVLNSGEKQKIVSFQDDSVAEKTKNVLNEIIDLMNKITEPNKAQPLA